MKKIWVENPEAMLNAASTGGKKTMNGENAFKIHSMGGKASIKKLQDWWTPELRKKYGEITSKIMSNMVWVNNGVINKRVPSEDVETYLALGFVRGRHGFTKKSTHKK